VVHLANQEETRLRPIDAVAPLAHRRADVHDDLGPAVGTDRVGLGVRRRTLDVPESIDDLAERRSRPPCQVPPRDP
jgi:hypothetical protein